MSRQPPTGERVVEELNKCGVTHIVWLPDSVVRFMYDAMMGQPGLTLVPVCREGEAMAVAMGLWLGGKRPVILHQSSGFVESGDSIMGLGLELQLPVVLLLGYVGWRRSSTEADSAKRIEPTLDTWGINHYMLETEDEVENISKAYREAIETSRPVAVLIAREQRKR